jgi:hypothetical protein
VAKAEDLRWGIKLGSIIGVGYTALAVLIFALSGSSRFDKLGVSLGWLSLVYLAGGFAGGFVLGMFRSALEERDTAFVVSVIAAIPVSIGLTLLLTGHFSNWTMEEWTTSAFLSLLIAVIGMAVLWKEPE